MESLLALLEGRIDSDALFFTRELTITGDASAVVTLRNVLDRETIGVLDEASSLFGPLRRFARAAVAELGAPRRAAARPSHARPLGRRRRANGERDVAAENEVLRAEIETLKTRLSKLEARQRRKEGAAA